MGIDQAHNDNDIVDPKGKYNDNDIVCEDDNNIREKVLKNITEYKLAEIQRFMFGGPSKCFGDTTVFVNPAIKQIERFAYVWIKELDEETRKTIIDYCLRFNGDDSTREYRDYLNSPIWKYVSSLIKLIKNYTCEMCEEQSNPAHLVVHHCTYAHLGSEFDHLDEVTVLCTDCHLKVHGIRRSK